MIFNTKLTSWPLADQRFWCLFSIFFYFPFSIPLHAQTDPSPTVKLSLPSLLVCGQHETLYHVKKYKIDWEFSAEGKILDVQPQPLSCRFLVVGGPRKVFLLRKVDRGCRIVWDWSRLEGVDIACAAAADWDLEGLPTLVLAGDTRKNRLFLAEARSFGSKMRWEYKLPAAPRSVRICPDSGNFLVTLADSTVEEVYFQEDKTVWSLGKEDGLEDARDAVRGPEGYTFVADASDGSILCFNPGKKLLWRSHLPFTLSNGSLDRIFLSLYKKNGRRTVMVSVHFEGDAPGAKDMVFLLNAESGRLMAWSDHLERGAFPPFIKVVPDTPSYYKKQ